MRKYDNELYKARHAVENLFEKMKQYRCFATRYEKLKVTFQGLANLVAAMVWLKI